METRTLVELDGLRIVQVGQYAPTWRLYRDTPHPLQATRLEELARDFAILWEIGPTLDSEGLPFFDLVPEVS